MTEGSDDMTIWNVSDPAITSPFGSGRPAPLVGPRLTVSVRDAVPIAQISAMPQKAAALIAEIAAHGFELPPRTGTSTRSPDGTVAHCQSPGRWLVEIAGNPLPDLDPQTGSVTDLRQARASFAFAGEDAVELAQKLAPVDFADAQHGPMSFVQSGSDHSIDLALWRDGADSFVVYVERSFARDFWHVLDAETAEFRH